MPSSASQVFARLSQRKAVRVTGIGLLIAAAIFAVVTIPSGTGDARPLEHARKFDAEGRLAETRDAAGRTTVITYTGSDGNGPLTRTRRHADGTEVAEQYDRTGRLAKLTDPTGTTQYEYDGFGRLKVVTRPAGAVRIDYTPLGQPKEVACGAMTLRYRYDFLQRLEAIETSAGTVRWEYTTDEGGLPMTVRRLPNGVRTEVRRDPNGRVSSIAHLSGERPLARFEYDYRPDGLLAVVRERWPQGEETRAYHYDSVKRLTSVSDSRHGMTVYEYDAVGHRTVVREEGKPPVAASADWAGRLTAYAGSSCRNDAAGNLTTRAGPDGRHTYAYTVNDQLADATGPNGTATYTHDGSGSLVARSGSGPATAIVPDPLYPAWRPLVIREGDRETGFVWDGIRPLAAVGAAGSEFFLTDYMGTVRLVVGPTGEVSRRQDFDPYGVPEQPVERLTPGFAGLFFDPTAGAYLTHARAYDPRLGRFLQRDPLHRIPLGSQKDLSAYSYCGGDPVNFVDLDGAKSWQAKKLDSAVTWWDDKWRKEGEYAVSILPELEWYEKPFVASFAFTAANMSDLKGLYYWSKLPLKATKIGDTLVNYGEYAFKSWEMWDDSNSPEDRQKAAEGIASKAVEIVAKSYFKEASELPPEVFKTADTVNKSLKTSLDIYKWYRDKNPPSRSSPDAPSYSTSIDFSDVRIDRPSGPSVKEQMDNAMRGRTAPTPSVKDQIDNAIRRGGTPPASTPSTDFNYNRRNPAPGAGPKTSIGFDDSRAKGGNGGPPIGDLLRDALSDANKPRKSHDSRIPDSALNQQKVGGVRLGGAGAALHIGRLKGVALDPSGRLVLIADDNSDIDLPPLRLDDVVTVFRCVYDRGEAPWVTIDPDPTDTEWVRPHSVINDEGTRNTYVGWVLFEADRLMKCYGAGIDNVTKQPVRSRVPDYRDDIQLGFDFWGKGEGGRTQHRNWIVPAESNRDLSRTKQLTLLDVRLRVRTERTTVRDGKIVDAPELGRAPTSEAFVKWFSDHYDDIAREAHSVPPPESGLTRPVAVFEETKRIALLTAVAETLRDQGVPMPAWMRTFKVRPCPIPKQTPPAKRSETRTVGDQKRTMQIWGGAQMAVADANRKVRTDVAAAAALEAPVLRAVAATPSFTPVPVAAGGGRYVAVPLPGADTAEPGGLRLPATDLSVPLGGTAELALTRQYSSFFDPEGEFGTGWTLDLPQLDTAWRAGARTDLNSSRSQVWQLNSPLRTAEETFSRIEMVPEAGAKLGVPDRPGMMLGLTGEGTDERVGVPTSKLLFRDGHRWHFDKAGRLAAVEESPVLRVYRRGSDGRVSAIEGWVGGSRRGEIRLAYNTDGTLREAGAGDRVVKYSYLAGRLARVEGPGGTLEYAYRDGMLAEVRADGGVVRKYEFGPGGRLTAEVGPGGERVGLRVERDAGGVTVTADRDGRTSTARYDAEGRLVGRTFPDGTRIECRDESGMATATLLPPDGGPGLTLARSADGRREELRLPTGGTVATELDTAGRPEVVRAGGAEVLRVSYRPDGQVETVRGPNYSVRPVYRDGALGAVRVATGDPDRPADWIEVERDDAGRVRRVSSAQGRPVEVQYGPKGNVGLDLPQGKVRVDWDPEGRLRTVSASWGRQWDVTYAADGLPTELRATVGQSVDTAKLEGGLVRAAEQFDGGRTRFEYGDGADTGRLRRITPPNGLRLEYTYDPTGRPLRVECEAYRLEYEYDADGRLVRWAQLPPRRPEPPH